MVNFTSNTYQMKREILTFSNKISHKLSKPEKKFTADMVYGMLASKSCLLTDIVDQLHEDTKKVNSVERLTRHLNKGIPSFALKSLGICQMPQPIDFTGFSRCLYINFLSTHGKI